MTGINRNNYEEWFFEYFEGALSKEDRSSVLNFVETDPLYKEEFEMWEKTYVREPLPPRLALEKILLRKTPGSNYWGLLTEAVALVAFAVVATTASSPLSVVVPIQTLTEQTNHTAELPATTAQVEETGKRNNTEVRIQKRESIEREKYYPAADFNLSVPTEEATADTSVSTPVATDTTATSTTTAADPVVLEATDKHPQEGPSINTNSNKGPQLKQPKKKLSKRDRKMLRKIDRIKAKQIEERKAEEFMKGKEPYVVPTNPNF